MLMMTAMNVAYVHGLMLYPTRPVMTPRFMSTGNSLHFPPFFCLLFHLFSKALSFAIALTLLSYLTSSLVSYLYFLPSTFRRFSLPFS